MISFDCSGMKKTLFILFVVVYIWIWFNGSAHAFSYGGNHWTVPEIHYYYNTNNEEGCLSARSYVEAAAQTWTDVTCSEFQFIYEGLSSKFNFNRTDGENTVCWGTGTSSSWIGLTTIWGSGGIIVENDMFLNKRFTWSCSCESGKMDIQNICTHEFGHYLSLGDLYNSSDWQKTMYGYAAAGDCKARTLHEDDMNGIRFIYPSDPATGPPITTQCLTINPVIDGTFAPGEWDGAKEDYIDTGCSVAFPYYLYTANDDRYIYIGIDVVGDETSTGYHYGGVFFDTGHDEVLTASAEDAIEVDQDDTVYYKVYNGAGYDVFSTWTSGTPFTTNTRDEMGMIAAHGFDGSENSTTDHHIYEFKIPMALGELNTAQGETVGLYIYLLSRTDESYWPPDSGWTDPAAYGDINLATACTALPDVPVVSWCILVLCTVMTGFVIVLRI